MNRFVRIALLTVPVLLVGVGVGVVLGHFGMKGTLVNVGLATVVTVVVSLSDRDLFYAADIARATKEGRDHPDLK